MDSPTWTDAIPDAIPKHEISLEAIENQILSTQSDPSM
jgi:hypothetical protein